MADKRDILVRLLGEETVSRMADRAGDGLDRFGDKLDATEQDARDLDRQIADVEDSLKTLAVAFARTNDAADRIDITKAIRRQQAELRKLTKSRDLLPDFDDAQAVRLGGRLAAGIASGLSRAGGPISAALANAFGVIPPQAQVAIGAGIIGAVAAAGPLIGGTVAGAVVGAAGTGGILGGIAVAARHPQVQASAKLTGEVYADALTRAAESFVPATLDALAQVRGGIGDIEDDWERASRAASGMLRPLTGDILSGATELIDDFADTVERSAPAVRAFGRIAHDGLELVGDSLEELSYNSAAAGRALVTFWEVLETGVEVAVDTINGLVTLYGWMEKLGAALRGRPDEVARLAAEEEAARKSGDGMSEGLGDLADRLFGAGDAATSATSDVKSFTEQLAELHDQTLAAFDTETAFERALDETAEAAKRAKGGIESTTEAGRKNRDLLSRLVQETKAHAAAILARTGSEDMAAAVTEKGRQAFIRNAEAMGVSRKRAQELATQMFGIPNVNREVTVKTKQTPIDLSTLAGRIAAIKSKSVVISVHNKITTTRSEGRNVGIGDGIGGRASGGPIKAGVPYIVGEEGPELITPTRDGYVHDAQKTAAMRAAINGARGTAGGASGHLGGGQTVVAPQIVINAAGATGLDRVFLTWLEKAIRDAGGNPKVLGLGGDW